MNLIQIILHTLILAPLTIFALPTDEDRKSVLVNKHRDAYVAARQAATDPDGRLSCIPTKNANECEIRVTQHPWEKPTIDIYDPVCNEIDGGEKVVSLGSKLLFPYPKLCH
ncbi:uncharacterized protein LY89DRAFT_675119 [Mollisia scopiformis]|uniref:Uncharacterized protein n=1 Tax=Mollisia scopiformis TaxID=149040 RepID=A0A132BD15_MOLSC|nr:uncharacterized protein LY89DRAFT_675119 [Mollisia scopiformis]KUJ10261.1 hypothetical protein LY89DRAFT_675119 [Mollisia scopiformis]